MSYDRELIERLVPTIWDRSYAWGMVDQYRPDPSMPKAKAAKNQGNTLWAHLADIRLAWDRAVIPFEERRALLLIGGVGLTHTAAAAYEGAPRRTVSRRFERAVGRIADYLNGTNIADSYEEEIDNQ